MILGGATAVSAYAASPKPQSSRLAHSRSSPAAAAVTFAKRQRRWRRQDPAETDGSPEPGEGGLELLASLQSEPVSWSGAEAEPPQPGAAALRGADILRALQQKSATAAPKGAAAAKATKGRRRGGAEGQALGEAWDYANVRDLDVKSDWAGRLDELDRLLHELQAQQQQRD
ncbi:death domain associated protein [Wolffia australiana]